MQQYKNTELNQSEKLMKIGATTCTNLFKTRRQKEIPWDAWACERSIRMNCEVKLIATINQLDRV